MIRTNLSTRPFYNDRAVNFWLLVVAAVVAVATAFNANRVIHYSHSDTALAVNASHDEKSAAAMRTSAAKLRATIDAAQLDRVSDEARRANGLIDRRTFSWTELFNRFETTLPDDVRIAAVRPAFDEHGDVLSIAVVAKSVDDVNKFMENLEATGAFANSRSREEHFDEQGLLDAVLETVYTPSNAPAAAPAPAAEVKPGSPEPSREADAPSNSASGGTSPRGKQ